MQKCARLRLTGKSQMVQVENCTSHSLTINTGASEGCVLSSLLFSVLIFADDTMLLHLKQQWDNVENLTSWWQENCLQLNVSKTKNLAVGCRRQQRVYNQIQKGEQLEVHGRLNLWVLELVWAHPGSKPKGQNSIFTTWDNWWSPSSGPEDFQCRCWREHPHTEHNTLV